MRRRVFLAVLTLAAGFGLASGPALAQQSALMPGISLGGSNKPKLTPEQQEKQDRLDRAYKAATDSQPAAKPVDPWGGARAPTQSTHVTEKPTRSRRDR
ncbi:MAG: hypothetical protein ACTHLY_15630 [Pseudolabrys sp.]